MSKIRVLHYTTHDEECGIAKYQSQFISGMKQSKDIENVVFRFSPNQTKHMSQGEFKVAMDELSNELKAFDILHIQHEHSFYKRDELVQLVAVAHKLSKKVMFTIHTAPDAMYEVPVLRGYGPHSILSFLIKKRIENDFLNNHIKPFINADLLVVHNNVTKESLVRHGVDADKIKIIRHPVPNVSFSSTSQKIRHELHAGDEDRIFCTIGFLSKSKGTIQAIKALEYLPDNYKLAIIGGTHPDGVNDAFFDEVTDQIINLKLKDRVYITGYVDNDDELNAMIRECDVCVYPYDHNYYSYVSSGSLNNAIANHKPVIAYRTKSFEETNAEMPVISFCKSPNYYELARAIRNINIVNAERISKDYANQFGWENEAIKFADFYRELV